MRPDVSILLSRILAPVPVWRYPRTKARHGRIYTTSAPHLDSTTLRSRQRPQEMPVAPRSLSTGRRRLMAPPLETPTTLHLLVSGIFTSPTPLMEATHGQSRMQLRKCRCNVAVSCVVAVVMLCATSPTFSILASIGRVACSLVMPTAAPAFLVRKPVL